MCNSEQPFIQQNICELLEKVKQCCLSKEEVSNLRQQIDSIQLWINEFDKLTANDIVINQSIGDFPQNTPIQTILEYLYENINNSTEGDYQDSIQFKKTGINLGSNGTVKEINFIGGGIDVNRTANVLTVNVPSSNTNLSVGNRNSTNLDVISSTGVNATLPPATTSLAGLFTSVDKLKLDGIQSGEVNTANNIGTTGVGIFKQKTGVNLEFKKLNALSNKVSITEDTANDKVDIDINVPNLTGISQSQVTNLTTDLASKQKNIQFKKDGIDVGTTGIVETINFTGTVVTASLTGSVLTIDIAGSSGSGSTNLGYTPSPTQGIVTSDTGVDAILPLADGTNAGLFAPNEKTKLGFIAITQNVDLDQLESDTVTNNAKVTNATHTGDVSGATVLTLATVNTNVGTFGSSSQIPQLTVNGKGLITAVSNIPISLSASSITGTGNITKTDDTNVTLSLGGVPNGSVLNNVSFTLGWAGTLSIARGGTGLSTLGTANQQLRVNAGGTALEYFTPSSTGITSFNGLTTGTQTVVNDSNITIVSAGSTHTITWVGTLSDSRITSASNWNTAYSNRITSLTTTGNSGASTLVSNVLNIPNYTLNGLGGQPLSTNLTSLSSLSYVSNSFVKLTAAGTFSLDTNNYYLASNPNGYTSNTGTVTSVSALTIGTTGTDITSTVVNNISTPVITLNIPTASSSNRGALSSTDWTTFNSKQSAITLTTTGTSGAATFISNTLNIPTYTLAGLGGQTALIGTGIVKSTGGTISYVTDNSSTWDKSYQQNKIRVVSVNTTLSATTDGTVVFDTASTTATLPSSVNETILVIKNNSGGTITVSGHIDGIASSNYVLQTRESMKFHGNGTTWYYIG